jgi:hypothetical protein
MLANLGKDFVVDPDPDLSFKKKAQTLEIVLNRLIFLSILD